MRLYKKKWRSENRRHSVTRPDYLILEPLEPRILLSADAIGGSFDASDTDFANPHLTQSHDDLRATLQFKLSHLLDHIPVDHSPDAAFSATQPFDASIPQSLDLDAFALLLAAPPTARVEIIIVDADVPDTSQLLAQLRQDPAVDYQVHFLDADRSGVAQVSAILQNAGTVDAVHLLSHGAAGEWRLGSDRIAADTLPQLEISLRQWESYLTNDADILVYGCDVAASDTGQTLLVQLANLTGADVAASDDKTGATELGADWHLEFRTGEIDAVMPFAGAVKANWSHSLATIVVTSDADTALPFGVSSVASLITREDITLRQAIQAVNYDFQFVNKTVHTIAFDLDGTDYTITLGTALPNVAAAVVIDGRTDPNYTDTPVVTLTGDPILLNVTGSNITVRGLVLQGSGGDAMVITGSHNVIAGNHFIDNETSGVYVKGGSYNVIGGTADGDRNVISGNGLHGVYIGYGGTAQGNQVIGNYIGVSVDGQSDYSNASYGIRMDTLSKQTNAATTIVSGNVISANIEGGIYLGSEAYHVDILNNLIGVAADGKTDLGNGDTAVANGVGHGITVKTGASAPQFPGFPVPLVPSDILIQGNTIAYNEGAGVNVENDYTFDVKMVQNRIYANDGLGIDLSGDGVTPNDSGDLDVGENSLNNFPVISTVAVVDGKIQITGSISNSDKTSGPGPKPLPIEIHFYYSSSTHTSGHGDARVYIGSVTVTPNTAGNATFDKTFNAIVPDGSYITATATTERGTSEFALSVSLPVGNENPINLPPSGAVIITGSMVQGALLTASNNLVDGNGLSGQIRYQWLRNGTAVSGATNTTYTLTQEDVGAIITLEASYTDNAGFEEVVSSTDYGPVQNINDAPTGGLAIDGTAEQGQTLTVDNSIDDLDGNPESFSYQWWRDGVEIEGATGESYTLTQDEVGSVITVSTTYEDGYGAEQTLVSLATGVVGNINDLPVGSIGIQGNPRQNETLSVDLNFEDTDGVPAQLNYQWYRNEDVIQNATGETYTLTQRDVGYRIWVQVSYADLQGTGETLTSDRTDPVINVNDPPSGEVKITGTPLQGQTLNANAGISDGDGMGGGAHVYQWYRGVVPIAGATQLSYTLTQADVGTQVSVTVFFTDAQGTDEHISSEPTAIVGNINDAPTGGLTIIGTVVEGQTLAVQNTVEDPDGNPASFEYQWLRNGAVISGATDNSYTLTSDDVGRTLTVRTVYVDGGGVEETIISAATAPVASSNQAPTGNLVIVGMAQQGETLSVDNTLADPDGNPTSFPYQWYRNNVAISGATGDTYTLTQADVGNTITVRTTYIDGHNVQETAISAATAQVANINDDPTGSLIILGRAEQGRTFTVQNTIADLDGIPASFTYQWLRDGVEIEGATGGTYTLTEADVDGVISVRTTYVDNYGETETVTSAATARVTNINDDPTGNLIIDGLAEQGQTLRVENTIIDPDGNPASFTYQWLRDGEAITGATGDSYTLTQVDVGSTITVTTTYVDGQGTAESVTSDPTGPVDNINDAPTGTVMIDGDLQVGSPLTATQNIVDIDGISGPLSYQWYRDGIAIPGANAQTYSLDQNDVGGAISVAVFYTDNQGTAETLVSAASAPVRNVNDAPVGELLISGIATEDQTLTITHAFTDADGLPTVFQYQWYRDGVIIEGAASIQYTLTDADVGSRITAAVFYHDLYGEAETLVSMATAPVAGVNDAPVGNLTIVGNPIEGGILTVNNGVSDADGIPAAIQWQWYRDGVAIDSANTVNYQLTAADIGATISVGMRYTDGQGYAENMLSPATGVISAFNYAPQGEVRISGNPQPGEILRVSNTLSDGNGINSGIQFIWQRDGEILADQTGAFYQLTEADRGTTISVLAVYTDARGFEEMVLSNLVEVSLISPPENPSIPQNNLPPPAAGDTSSTLENGQSGKEPEAVADEQAAQSPEVVLVVNDDFYQSAGSQDQFVRVGGSAFDTAAAAAGGDFLNFNDMNSGLQRYENIAAAMVASAEKILMSGALQSVIPSLQESFALLNNSDYSRDLQQAVQNIKDNPTNLTAAIVGGTAAVSTGLSVGYVIWTLRSGILVTGLLSSLPAWRFIDPLPILSGANSGDADEDDESLESLVSDDRPAIPASNRAGVQ